MLFDNVNLGIVVSWVSFVLGIIAAVFIPYLNELQSDAVAALNDPEAPPPDRRLKWKYIWPKLLSVIIVLVSLPLLVADLSIVATLGPQAAWLLGMGSASPGEYVRKALDNRAKGATLNGR